MCLQMHSLLFCPCNRCLTKATCRQGDSSGLSVMVERHGTVHSGDSTAGMWGGLLRSQWLTRKRRAPGQIWPGPLPSDPPSPARLNFLKVPSALQTQEPTEDTAGPHARQRATWKLSSHVAPLCVKLQLLWLVPLPPHWLQQSTNSHQS